jgi:hypothetical protein
MDEAKWLSKAPVAFSDLVAGRDRGSKAGLRLVSGRERKALRYSPAAA